MPMCGQVRDKDLPTKSFFYGDMVGDITWNHVNIAHFTHTQKYVGVACFAIVEQNIAQTSVRGSVWFTFSIISD